MQGSGDYVGGFTGYAHLGTLFGFGEYLVEDADLLSTLKGLVTALLGEGEDQTLLDLGGVAPSAILGFTSDTSLEVSSEGGFVGVLVGRGNRTIIGTSVGRAAGDRAGLRSWTPPW